MRKILFRGKAINRIGNRQYRTNYKNGDWVYGLIERLYDDDFPNIPATMRNTDGVSDIDIDYTTIGQYTGLKDKNGKRIFEGDIVVTNKLGTPGTKYIIEYDVDIATYIGIYKRGYIEHFTTFSGDADAFEVIGNVHDGGINDGKNSEKD